ncbi:hypothetical protein D3C73_1025600 [compost metagenome]
MVGGVQRLVAGQHHFHQDFHAARRARRCPQREGRRVRRVAALRQAVGRVALAPAKYAGGDRLPGAGRIFADEAAQVGLAALGQFHAQRGHLAVADGGRDLAVLHDEDVVVAGGFAGHAGDRLKITLIRAQHGAVENFLYRRRLCSACAGNQNTQGQGLQFHTSDTPWWWGASRAVCLLRLPAPAAWIGMLPQSVYRCTLMLMTACVVRPWASTATVTGMSRTSNSWMASMPRSANATTRDDVMDRATR